VARLKRGSVVPVERITQVIRVLRGQRVLLDAELAALYGVTTKPLNEQVKRNRDRFPEDFLFQLSVDEVAAMNRSQIATGSHKHRDPRFRPFAFTEHGAIMAATVLSSPRAVEMSVYVVRAFVQLRELLASNTELARQLDELEARIEKKLDLARSGNRRDAVGDPGIDAATLHCPCCAADRPARPMCRRSRSATRHQVASHQSSALTLLRRRSGGSGLRPTSVSRSSEATVARAQCGVSTLDHRRRARPGVSSRIRSMVSRTWAAEASGFDA